MHFQCFLGIQLLSRKGTFGPPSPTSLTDQKVCTLHHLRLSSTAKLILLHWVQMVQKWSKNCPSQNHLSLCIYLNHLLFEKYLSSIQLHLMWLYPFHSHSNLEGERYYKSDHIVHTLCLINTN